MKKKNCLQPEKITLIKMYYKINIYLNICQLLYIYIYISINRKKTEFKCKIYTKINEYININMHIFLMII